MPVNRKVSVLARLAAALGILVLSGASIASYRSPIRSDRQQSVTLLRSALSDLDDTRVDASHALERYRAALAVASSRLRRAVSHYPLDSAALARLAAVQWETDRVWRDGTDATSLGLVELAAARGPRDPGLHAELGSLLYKMGAREDAAALLKEAVTLSPQYAERVIKVMLTAGESPIGVSTLLPPTPEVLTSLEYPFVDAGLATEYCKLVEPFLPSAGRELIRAYSDTSMLARREDELLKYLSSEPGAAHRETRALRLAERGRAMASLGNRPSAAATLEELRSLQSPDWVVRELLGEDFILLGDGPNALLTLHSALEFAAATQVDGATMARLYRRLGQAEEIAGQPERAFDAYRQALRLDPGETFARVRLGSMASAAGYAEPSRTPGGE